MPTNTQNITESRVVHTARKITSRTALARAVKARETLATARAILRTSGHKVAAEKIDLPLGELSSQIRDYYQSSEES